MFAQHWRQTLPYVLLSNLAGPLFIYIFLRVTTSTPSSVSSPENRTWPQALGPQIAWAKLHEMPLKNVCVCYVYAVCSIVPCDFGCDTAMSLCGWGKTNGIENKHSAERVGNGWVGFSTSPCILIAFWPGQKLIAGCQPTICHR